MKKILYIFLLATLSVACDKYLDLAPEDILTEEQVFANEVTAESALADVYNKLLDAITTTYVLGDLTTTTVTYDAGSSWDNYKDMNFDNYDSNIETHWLNYYTAVNAANVFINQIPTLGQYDETVERLHMAEAKVVRAYSFLNLLLYFGEGSLNGNETNPGIVLNLDDYSGFDIDNPASRATNGETYVQIIKDLKEALPDLYVKFDDDTNELKSRGRATKGAAYALLSRVYLYRGEYALSAAYADSVMTQTEGFYELSSFEEVFPYNDAETGGDVPLSGDHIWSNPVSYNGGNWQFGGNGLYYAIENYYLASSFVTQYDSTDLRYTYLIYEGHENSTKDEQVTTFKFNNNNERDNIPLIRYAEVLLTKAEAEARSLNSITSNALSALNLVYLRAFSDERTGFETSDFSTVDEFIAEVLQQRKLELACEGLHRFDVIRTGQDLSNASLPDNKKVLPIPGREVDLSGGVIVQNSGYID